MKTILVFGMGKVGTLVGILLNKRFAVTGFDKNNPTAPTGFDCIQGDIHDQSLLEKTIPQFDAVVSCMPYNLNLSIARIAHAHGIHYFDLTEDVPTTEAIMQMSLTATAVMAPQCGLAPGL